ncbi:MAG: DASH family cryptochrome [Elainellaceae cyanobacterium]
MTNRILIWYRNDLRLHDHEPLTKALKAGAKVIPVYCFDSRQFGTTAFGFPKTGPYRARFLLESVADLRNSLRSLGSDLVIRCGEPEKIVPQLAQDLGVNGVYYYREATSEETRVEDALAEALEPLGVEQQSFWGATLHHVDDLPFELSKLPDVFTQFRKAVEKNATVYPTFPQPGMLRPLPDVDVGALPTPENFGVEPRQPDERGVMAFEGGETAGKQRLEAYFWQQDNLRRYKQTRNGMLGADYSSKFSPWLALGCLSPRYVYEEVQRYEQERVGNDSTYWLVFELRWRDYFRFVALKYGNALFRPAGIQGIDIPWEQDWDRFERWQKGETGFPLVDANMRELAATGFMSNRGRQNVASFLTKNLGIDWRMGAEWFESRLVDYDVCSNYGNWNYTAGVGNDARGFRYFNIPKQSKDYDQKGHYVKHWLPVLADVPASKVHEPWKLSNEEQKRCGVRIGVDYPNPIVDLYKSVKHNEQLYNEATA